MYWFMHSLFPKQFAICHPNRATWVILFHSVINNVINIRRFCEFDREQNVICLSCHTHRWFSTILESDSVNFWWEPPDGNQISGAGVGPGATPTHIFCSHVHSAQNMISLVEIGPVEVSEIWFPFACFTICRHIEVFGPGRALSVGVGCWKFFRIYSGVVQSYIPSFKKIDPRKRVKVAPGKKKERINTRKPKDFQLP